MYLYRISIHMICMKSKICLCVDTDLPFDALNKKTSRLMYIYIYTCTHTHKHTHTQPHYSLLSLIHMRIHIRTTPYRTVLHTHSYTHTACKVSPYGTCRAHMGQRIPLSQPPRAMVVLTQNENHVQWRKRFVRKLV